MIPWNTPKFGNTELELVEEVLSTGFVSEGPKTKELEDKLSKIVKAKHVIMTTSATAALYLAIEADKIIRKYVNGQVLTSNVNFVADINAIELAKLYADICDVDKDKFLLDISKSNYANIIIPVNLLGRAYKLPENRKDTIFICDNAGCLGSNVPNGKVGCYSLQANKLLTCGQGGFCATDDEEYAKVIRQIKDFGRTNKDDNDTIGFNFKFNDIQAAVALGQLSNLTERKVKAVNQYLNYREELSKFGKFIDFDINNGEIPLWIEFITDKRDELFNYLKNNGIEARKPWKPLLDNPTLYPNTETYTKNCIWLPGGFGLTFEEQEEVIKSVKEFYVTNS